MRNIALKLMYAGTAYHGWQVQKNAVTVAETLERALATVVGHPVKLTGAGRTDAGVHAQVYVANFRTSSAIPCDRLPLAVNTRLPDDIVVVKATRSPMSSTPSALALRRNTPIASTIPTSEIRFMSTAFGFIPDTWTRPSYSGLPSNL